MFVYWVGMKVAYFVGTAREELAAFPDSTRRRAGYELFIHFSWCKLVVSRRVGGSEMGSVIDLPLVRRLGIELVNQKMKYELQFTRPTPIPTETPLGTGYRGGPSVRSPPPKNRSPACSSMILRGNQSDFPVMSFILFPYQKILDQKRSSDQVGEALPIRISND